ncbi:uncharacterized protein LOC126779211 [Nymphalis io]|uniref:uncharacterized protein LOC126779211 n=1 Tax=Inachis io TaxID=171585 RepID=UPI002168C297|nr:uncharacterized protein LOC126779211 [Nymphalis io]
MRAKIIFTLMGVVQIFQAPCIATTAQSEVSDANSEPISVLNARERQRDTPEVVLQLKYDGGELNKIYLTQFRKENKGWVPSVPARGNLCTDLCRAGLGGTTCGSTCLDLVPVGLKSALSSSNETNLKYGEPRDAVCPVLCENGLGQPLCNCESKSPKSVDWNAVCGTFCATDKYVLYGCPVCDESKVTSIQLASTRVLNTAEGWKSWCNVQCRQGQGGAACNCDRAPFQ